MSCGTGILPVLEMVPDVTLILLSAFYNSDNFCIVPTALGQLPTALGQLPSALGQLPTALGQLFTV